MSMTVDELGLELRRMAEDGKKRREKNAMIVLFGIKFADELKNVRVKDVIKETFGKTPSRETQINTGRQLAKYVTPR